MFGCFALGVCLIVLLILRGLALLICIYLLWWYVFTVVRVYGGCCVCSDFGFDLMMGFYLCLLGLFCWFWGYDTVKVWLCY